MASRFAKVLCVCVVVVGTGCVIVQTVSTMSMTPEEAVGTDVRTPLKAFHSDGTITVFPDGARVSAERVEGRGQHYSLDLSRASE